MTKRRTTPACQVQVRCVCIECLASAIEANNAMSHNASILSIYLSVNKGGPFLFVSSFFFFFACIFAGETGGNW